MLVKDGQLDSRQQQQQLDDIRCRRRRCRRYSFIHSVFLILLEKFDCIQSCERSLLLLLSAIIMIIFTVDFFSSF